MWVKAYVEERSDGLVEILVKAHKGFYKVWVHPDNPARVEIMVDGVLKGRASTKLRELEEGIEIKAQKTIRKRSSMTKIDKIFVSCCNEERSDRNYNTTKKSKVRK